jgi:hypothetical protein
MKKIYSFLFSLLFVSTAFSQSTICNASGNLMLFTNYDGGNLNIDVDVNIPNLKIGIVGYEGTAINIGGTYASNVTAVTYAGFSATNAHCGSVITTSISGTSGTCVNTIQFAPTATLTNPNGYGSIVCGYSCSTTTNQGGCNTVDQIEAYFLSQFPGSTVYAHKVQYGCWTGSQTVSGGGTCCGLTTGITDAAENPNSLFPNPATNSITVATTTAMNKATIKVFNISGELIKEENNVSGMSVTLDITALSKGVYFIETTNVGVVSHKKFVKS